MNITVYILAFCRIVIALVFLVSSFSKVRDFAKFRQAIISFDLLPERLNGIIAVVFLCGEFSVTGLVAFGGNLLLPGFLLALILLLVFSGALASVLARQIQTTCHCFGPGEKPVNASDILRNVGFMLWALVACVILVLTKNTQANLGWLEWVFTGFGAIVFVVIWIQLGEIMQLFRQDHSPA